MVYLFMSFFMIGAIFGSFYYVVAYRGTIIMHRWLSHYVRQTPVTAWVYLSVFLCMLLIIGVTVFGNIRRAMIENPADVIKSE